MSKQTENGLPRGAAAWSRGEGVCWCCGYSITDQDARARCPECGAEVEVSRSVAPLAMPHVRGLWIVLGLIGIQACFVLFAISPFVLAPWRGESVGPWNPLIWFPPATMITLGAISFPVVGVTRPPAALGLRTPSRLAASAAVLTIACAAAFLIVATAQPPANDAVPILFGFMTAGALASLCGVCWVMMWVARRMRSPQQARRWRSGAIFFGISSVLTIVATSIAAVLEIDPINWTLRWYAHIPGLLAFFAGLIAIVVMAVGTAMFAVRVLSQEAADGGVPAKRTIAE